MAIIAMANQKGGVGKTTLAVHLAVGAAQRGQRVILVDADPQGNATSWLMDGETDEGLFRLLVLNEKAVRAVRPLGRWGLGLVPGNYRTGEALTMLAAVGRLAEIPARVKPLAEVCDLVIVDMPPSRSAGFVELLSATDWIIIPTQLERLALEGVSLMAQMEDLVGAFGQAVWPPVPLTIRVTEAVSYGKVLFGHCPDEAVTGVMQGLVDRMLEVLSHG